MESTRSVPSIPFKSKKPLLTSTPKKPPPPPPLSAVVTPERSNPQPRIRNQTFALSINDVRRTALKLRKPNVTASDLSVGAVAEKPKRSEKSTNLLPEKYEMLCEFFNAMVNSVRLLRLKRLPSTFTKLFRNIESLTDRRFTLHHLAQLKHILPEVISIKKIRVQYEETNCMKEDLLIMLEADAVQAQKTAKETSGFSHLKGIFRSRITDYSTTHPEGDDIPEGELPQLFHHAKPDPEPSTSLTPTSLPTSHISPSFKRRFSSKALSTPLPESSPDKPSTSLPETPIKEATSTKGRDGISSTPINGQKTPAKFASTPARLMATTPSLRPPKRSLMSPDHDISDLPNKSAKRRSLKFDENHGDIDDQPSQIGDGESSVLVQDFSASKDVLGVLPEDLLQLLIEKERRMLEQQDPVVSQAKRRQQLMAGVPKLFDMIHLLFQSTRRSVITKEELIYKLVAGHLEIVDRREVEEQLKLLQEVAPEYISEQSCLSGDILLRLNKSSCADSIRAKLLEAK